MNREPTIINLAMAIKDTEYSQVIPNGTTKLLIRSRNSNDIKLSYTDGESGTKFITIPAGSTGKWIEALELNGKTLYMQYADGESADVAEIEIWK